MPDPTPRQPWLHDLSVCVNGAVTALSDHGGQIDGGAQGVYADDRRIVSLLRLDLDGTAASPIAHSSSGARSDFLGAARHLGDPGADPTVEVRRHRTVAALEISERIVVLSRAASAVETLLTLRVAGDGAGISAVKSGKAPAAALVASVEGGVLGWADRQHSVRVWTDAPGATAQSDPAGGGVLTVPLRIDPGGSAEVTATFQATRLQRTNLDLDAGSVRLGWSAVAVHAQDSVLAPTVRAALDDLQHLLVVDPEQPEELFAAAGTPWFLTLFGRDALWAARMMLPFGTELAAGTLRALARRQGTGVDEARAEAVGKIPHEVRRSAHDHPENHLSLPATYYGTVDATSLWIALLHDAWRWGMPAAQVEALLPNLQAATGWLTGQTASDSAGLLRYIDNSGKGLTNQGWKDSGDAIRWRDGRIAEAPIALVEAQAYAVEAAGSAAALLDGFGRPGGAALRDWAEAMRARVREQFWVGRDAPGGPWLAIAVDGAGRAVDGLASNMGHVLGTGTLDARESARVAATLTAPTLLDTFGVRTLASDNGGYNPIGYHTGSIWTHDTAICAWNLSRAGFPGHAARVARTLMSASVAFGHHWPELYSGADALDRPAAYPAACRPQAWAAASAGALLSVALGFEPDAPSERLALRPCRPAPFGELTVRGVKFGGATLTVHCSADGSTTVLDAAPDINVDVL